MCIYFLFVDNNPSENGYQIIAVNNRDETYDRPTKPAYFWDPRCISGVDAQPGKEGGTWFGLNTTGKIGALLNILEPSPENDMKGRGCLVTDFLRGEVDAFNFSNKVAAEKSEYNAFNLVLLEKRNNEWSVFYTSSLDDASPRRFSSGVLAFGNSVYDKPWQKVVYGKAEFAEIVERHGKNSQSPSERDALKRELLNLLSDRKCYLPDLQLESQLSQRKINLGYCDGLSAKFVDLAKSSRYGTRTHTVLLIDAEGQGEYLESTMHEPIGDHPTWDSVTHTFQLNQSNRSLAAL